MFESVLIANRGEIACRIQRTLRRLGIRAIQVYHPVDRQTPAVTEADEAIELVADPAKPPVAAYLDLEAIVAACRATGAQAVHPGYGFLAENAAFARRLAAAGIVFIGPTPDAIALMGDKIAARAFCAERGFPLAPSVPDGADFAARCAALGTPLLLKAAAGGGGKGMQPVHALEQLPAALRRARTESARSFGSDVVYAERYIDNPRHVEVQILADHHGTVLHLWERECSIQRRFQKVVEEAPSPTIDEAQRQALCATAVAIAKAAGYRNAGTVEFIVAPDGEFWFLEMNTRIQVEHPVTEAITGLDIVEQQLRIAAGQPLAFAQADVRRDGHAIELRLCAEDPARDFAPATGTLHRLDLPADVRVDSGVRAGQRIGSAFDSMLAKLIAQGPTREAAIAAALAGVEDTVALGLTTNLDFLAALLRHPAFAAARIDTGFIERWRDALLPAMDDAELRALAALAAIRLQPAVADKGSAAPRPAAATPHATIGAWSN